MVISIIVAMSELHGGNNYQYQGPLWYKNHLIRKKEQLWSKKSVETVEHSWEIKLHSSPSRCHYIANGTKFILRRTNVILFTMQSTGNGLALRFKTNAVNFEVTYGGYQIAQKDI